MCTFPLLLKFGGSEHAVRCVRCRGGPAAMAMAAVLRDRISDLGSRRVYELSSRGPLFRFLQARASELVYSEFFDDVPPGVSRDGVVCQDVRELTFPDASFDLCTSTDVFEHVPDDRAAFAEVRRVLKPGGKLVFTVPLNVEADTVERAIVTGQGIEHLLPHEYHNDRIRGVGQVLCFRNYGRDIIDRLRAQGFPSAEILTPDSYSWWNRNRHVVIAHR